MRLRGFVLGCVALIAAPGMGLPGARAGMITEVTFFTSGPGPAAALSGGTLGFLDDGVAGSPGLQEADLLIFETPPGSMPSFAGSVTIGGLNLSGPAVDDGFGTYSQALAGGTFALYDDAGGTLLAGDFTGGELLFEVDLEGAVLVSYASFTGGSLLPSLASTTGVLAALLLDLTPPAALAGGQMAPFTVASAQGTFSVDVIPEPSALALVLVGAAALAAAPRRRRGVTPSR
jgi:hypothetical protein